MLYCFGRLKGHSYPQSPALWARRQCTTSQYLSPALLNLSALSLVVTAYLGAWVHDKPVAIVLGGLTTVATMLGVSVIAFGFFAVILAIDEMDRRD